MQKKRQKIVAEVTEVSYRDNYENGQVGEVMTVPTETQTFDSVIEAVKWFKGKYEDAALPIELLEEECKIVAPHKRCKVDPVAGVFSDANDEDIEDWKAGKMGLYNVEHQLTVYSVVDSLDLSFATTLLSFAAKPVDA